MNGCSAGRFVGAAPYLFATAAWQCEQDSELISGELHGITELDNYQT